MFDHGIENRQQLAHASDERDFEQFALGSQPVVEVSDYGIASGGDQGRHVQSAAHGALPPQIVRRPLRVPLSRLKGARHQEPSNLFAIESSELRQLRDQGAAGDRADSREHRGALLIVFPDRVFAMARSRSLLTRSSSRSRART